MEVYFVKPLAIDLCCGLGGWAHGLLAEGWEVIGYDIERHKYGDDEYPGQLIIQDVLTLDGHKFRGRASLVVASPPCTEFSYMAMPWSRGKQIRNALLGRGDFPKGYKGSRTKSELTTLFDACFRIGREAGCPTIIENVRGAQEWVGAAARTWGSFYLWGDVPALMPIPSKIRKTPEGSWDQDFTRIAAAQRSEGLKLPGNNSPRRWEDREVKRLADAGVKGWKKASSTASKSKKRKQASAEIAKIPYVLASWIARVFKPKD